MGKIWIMRGLPGSGKSTRIKNHLPEATVFSADQHHMVMINGKWEYKYDPKNASKAHNICFRDYVQAVVDNLESDIVIDNTNTSIAELAPYVRIAEAFERDYEIVFLHTTLEVAVTRNIHQVPITTIMAMNANLLTEKLFPWWKHTIIFQD